MAILQLFNDYIDRGGEALSVERVGKLLGTTMVRFSSSEWTGPNAPPNWRQALLMYHNRESVARVRQAHAESHPDAWLLHNIFPVGSAGIFREALRNRVPMVEYIHNFRPFSVNGYLWANHRLVTGGLKKNFLPEILAGSWRNSRVKTGWYAGLLWMTHLLGYWRRISAWIAISDFMRDKFVEAGVPAERIFSVRHCWEPSPKEPDYKDDGCYLFLGRLISAKGIGTLCLAWDRLHDRLGARCPRLVIAGEGPLEAWVRRHAQQNPRIEYGGFAAGEAKTKLLRNCRALLVPSIWWEPLGRVVYEAYDYGKPVLAARSGGLTETVIPGETGLLHEPGNVESLVADVLQMEGESQLAARYGRAGRRWLLRNTRVEDWMVKMQRVFEFAKGHNLSM